MAATRYYTLVASFPRLVHFEQAEYVPITRQELESRLRMLTPQHHQQLDAAWSLLRWQKQPRERKTADLVEQYSETMQIVTDPALRELIEFWMGQRTVVVALRMRRLGESPSPDQPWGVEPWARRIAAHWDDSDLGVGMTYPWVTEAAERLEASDAIGVERLVMNVLWKKLTEIEGRTPFGFERVIAFVFKWEFVKRWLSYDAAAAKERFQELITEVIRDHEQLFA